MNASARAAERPDEGAACAPQAPGAPAGPRDAAAAAARYLDIWERNLAELARRGPGR